MQSVNGRTTTEGHMTVHLTKPAPDIYTVQIANIQGIGGRESQQDSFGLTDVSNLQKGFCAVVADGMGGIANGAEISQIVVSNTLRLFNETPVSYADQADLLLQMASNAHRNARVFIDRQGGKLSGSTMVAVIIKNSSLYFLSIGDSRIYLLRGGTLIQLNREHNYASDLDEKAARGEISWQEARNSKQRAALTSYIGVADEMKIDRNISPIPVAKGDRVLLMSDGVFGTLSEAELTEAASIPDIHGAGAQIEECVKANRKKNQDNFTAIILGL